MSPTIETNRLPKEATPQKAKKLYLELLRYLAIFLVIYNHTAGNGFLLFIDNTEPKWLYPIHLFVSQIDKIAVPLFFMISGALLLGKEEPFCVLLKRRVLKNLLVLLGISAFYLFYNDISLQQNLTHSNLLSDPSLTDPTLKDILARNSALKDVVLTDPDLTNPTAKDVTFLGFFALVYNQELSPQLWFLYAYIGAMLMLPFLRKIAKLLTYRESLYLLVGNLLFLGMIPIALYFINGQYIDSIGHFSIPMFTLRPIFYMLMGYFLEHIMPKEKYTCRNAIIAVALFFAFGAMDAYVTHLLILDLQEAGSADAFSYNLFSCLVAVPAMGVFFLVKYLFIKVHIPNILEKIIIACGSSVFGIYLLEAVLRRETYAIFLSLANILPKGVACSIWVLVCMFIGTVVTLLLKKIPGVRNLL